MGRDSTATGGAIENLELNEYNRVLIRAEAQLLNEVVLLEQGASQDLEQG